MRFSLRPDRLALKFQLSLVVAGLVVLTALGVAGVGYLALDRQIAAEIHSKTLWSLRDAVAVLRESMPHITVERNAAGEPERLIVPTDALATPYKSAKPLEHIVDTVTELNKGTATIFRWDPAKSDFVRIATTVKKADGSRAVGTVLGQSGVVYPFMMRKEAYRGIAVILGEPYQTGYLPIFGADQSPIGILYIGVGKLKDLAAFKAEFVRQLVLWSLGIIAAALALAMLAAGWLFRPMRILATATDNLAHGSGDVKIPFRDRTDELGTVARALEMFQSAVEQRRNVEAERLKQAESGRERKEMVDLAISEFRAAVSESLDSLKCGADEMRVTSGTISDAVGKADAQVRQARTICQDGSLAVTSVASATDQFAGSIAEIATQSHEAATIVRRAAEAGKRASATVGDLSAVVEKIEDTVMAIRSIADQTNLLALNATIEAARAGEAGRGFAVVATEVKALATETAKATTEISDLVANIQDVTKAVTEATGAIESDLATIDKTTMIIAAAVSEQESTTQEIAQNASRAAGSSGQIAEGFAVVSDVVQGAGASAADLHQMSVKFRASADRLIGQIEGFLTKVAA